MEISEFLNFMHMAENLKQVTRHSWTSKGRHEDVAAHSWRVALMAMMVSDEFKELDMNRVIKMCLVHDLGESITSDIPSFEKTDKDEAVEVEAQNQLINCVSGEFHEELKALFHEINEMKTKEAKLYKCLDKLEALIQHNEASLETWLDLERELQLTYGIEECETFEYTKKLRERVKQDSMDKMKEEGK